MEILVPGTAVAAAKSFVVVAPGRVNLIGEHTDYNDGLVLPMAIEPHIRIVVTLAADRFMELVTDRDGDEPIRVDLNKPLQAEDFKGTWAAYPCGVVAGLQRLGWNIPGFRGRISSTLPAGSGLSSSAALEVGIATVVESLCGRQLPPEDKALLAQRAEHEFAGVPCGIMDQFAVACGKAGHAMLLDCQTREIRYVPFAGHDVSVLVVNSGVRHSLADGEYAKRRRECASAAHLLGVDSLRQVSRSEWQARESTLPDVERRRSRHVITEHERTLGFVRDLEAAEWRAAGEKLYGSHASLRDDYEVSCQELDLLVDISRTIDGVYGCRMTGGGFGGCVVALIDANRGDDIQAAFRHFYRRATGIDPVTFITRPGTGATAACRGSGGFDRGERHNPG